MIRCLVPFFTLILLVGLVGCSSASEPKQEPNQEQKQEETKNTVQEVVQHIAGLPQGFPQELPIYTGAKVIESDNFNGNNYTILYSVNADYDKVLKFYVDAMDLDSAVAGDGDAYYEGIDFGDIFVMGLTIESAGDAVNVYMTLQDNNQNEGEADDSDNDVASSIVTYDMAEEVSLDESYPEDLVPIPDGAKIIGCSMVPGTSSGFVDLILPGSEFDATAKFYTEELGLTPDNNVTSAQETAAFKGEFSDIKVEILISHLLNEGNDTFVQIITNGK